MWFVRLNKHVVCPLGEAAEIIGVTDRTMRRWKDRYERLGYDGLFHRLRGKPSPKLVPVETVERVLKLYQETYFDFNVRSTRSWLRCTGSS